MSKGYPLPGNGIYLPLYKIRRLPVICWRNRYTALHLLASFDTLPILSLGEVGWLQLKSSRFEGGEDYVQTFETALLRGLCPPYPA